MGSRKDTVIVIKSINFSEKDKILTVYGKYRGKFSLFAKGIRGIKSKNRGNMQTLSMSNISYHEGKGLPFLRESQGVHLFDHEKIEVKNIERVLQLIDKVIHEDEPNEKVFSTLQSVVTKGLKDEQTSRFRLIFLQESGVLGDISSCSVCGSSEIAKIGLRDFEVFCKNCYPSNQKLLDLNKSIYSSKTFVNALDKYVKRVLIEMT